MRNKSDPDRSLASSKRDQCVPLPPTADAEAALQVSTDSIRRPAVRLAQTGTNPLQVCPAGGLRFQRLAGGDRDRPHPVDVSEPQHGVVTTLTDRFGRLLDER